MPKFKPKSNSTKHKSVGISKIVVTDLPSKGMSYDPGFEISYRPYTWGEVKHISGSKDLSAHDTANYVLDGIECNFDKLNITLSDFMYLGYLRKLSNNLASQTITATLVCPNCKLQDTYTIKNSQIDFDVIDCPKLPVNVSMGGSKMAFYPITIGDYLDLLNNKRSQDLVTQMAYMAINGRREGFDVIHKKLYDCDIESGELLEEVNNILYHGMKTIFVKCKCENDIEIELDSGITTDGGKVILQPFRKREDNVRDRISFGN